MGVAVAPAIALAFVSQPDRARVFALGLVLAGGAASRHGTRTGVLTALACTGATAAGYALAGDATASRSSSDRWRCSGALQAPARPPLSRAAAGDRRRRDRYVARHHSPRGQRAHVARRGRRALRRRSGGSRRGARLTIRDRGRPRWAETVYFAAGTALLGGVATYLAVDHTTIGGTWLTVMLLVVAPSTFAAILDREVRADVRGIGRLPGPCWPLVGLVVPELMPVVGLVGSVAVALVTRPVYWRFATLLGSGAILLVAAAPIGDAVVSTRTALASIAVAAVTAATAGLCLLADPHRTTP